MPEKKWVFDTVSLSNFFLSEALFSLEKRYRKCGFITLHRICKGTECNRCDGRPCCEKAMRYNENFVHWNCGYSQSVAPGWPFVLVSGR